MNARDTAVYWIEYVLRHHGAPHMQFPGINFNFIQRNSLDVIGFILLCAYVALKLFKILLILVFKIFEKNFYDNKIKHE